MQKLPRLSGKEVVRILSRTGFVFTRQKGSHIILVKQTADGKKAVVVPNHAEIDRGTLLEIIRQAGEKGRLFEINLITRTG
ncbi:MAG: type II toxin-antitoxin system HicA family toxin [Candidatus Woesearchaeota archaeon]